MKQRLTFAVFIALLMVSLTVTSCKVDQAKRVSIKKSTPATIKTRVIYVEGYEGTDSYDKPIKSRLIKLSVDGKKREVLGNFKGCIDDIALAPHADKLTFTAEGKLRILDLKNKKIITSIPHKAKATFINAVGEKTPDYTCKCEGEEFFTSVWSSDGAKLAYITRHYGLGINWATLDILDMQGLSLTQADVAGDGLFNTQLEAWVPGTNLLVVAMPERNEPVHKPQGLALLDCTDYKVHDIAEERSQFMGLWNGTKLPSAMKISSAQNDTLPVDYRRGIKFSVMGLKGNVNKVGLGTSDFKAIEALNKFIREWVELAVAGNDEVYYVDRYASGETVKSYTTYHNGKAIGRTIPVIDYTRFWKIDPSLTKRTLIAKQKDYFVRDLRASKDGRYLVYYREPFAVLDAMGDWNLMELASCDTRTGKITMLATSSQNYGQDPSATFLTKVPFVVYTED